MEIVSFIYGLNEMKVEIEISVGGVREGGVTYSLLLYLRPVYKVDNPGCAEAGAGQCYLGGSRHSDSAEMRVQRLVYARKNKKKYKTVQ